MPTGRIKYYNLNKGFGFIAQDSSEEDVFLHNSAIKYAEYEELRVGQRVKYTVVEGEKGLVAKNVEVLLTPTERRWLRQGKTIIPRGYSGFPAQNQDQFFDEDEAADENSETNSKHTQERWRKKSQKSDSAPQPEIGTEGKEQTSRQLSFGDLYILKQINFETPMFFALYNHEQLPAIVLEMTLAGLTLSCNEKEKVVPKTEIKYCYKEVDAENVMALLHYNEDIKTKQLKPARSQDEVYAIDAEIVRDARRDGNTIEIILREGEIFQGTVDWISPYEIKIVLKNGSKVVVFRHAICEFSVVEEEKIDGNTT
ncbi:MAG: cold shock domain-containing protein [Candidatus Poribacteria bacterium]|nr:cold shock domain-containing protein [Candidatus Poribacteria bacterium]